MSRAKQLPALTPYLNFDFSRTKKVHPAIHFARASSCSYYREDGSLAIMEANKPCITHNPGSLECQGLMLSTAKQNLVLHSDDIFQSVWLKTNISVSYSASKGLHELLCPTTYTFPRIFQWINGLTDGVHCFSVYIAAGTTPYFRFGVAQSDSDFIRGYINLNTKQINFDSTIGGHFSNPSATLQDVGGGIYRLVVVFNFHVKQSGGVGYVFISPSDTLNSNSSRAGDTVYVGRFQLENTGGATQPIITADSAVSQARDIAYYNDLPKEALSSGYAVVQQLNVSGYSSINDLGTIGVNVVVDAQNRARFMTQRSTKEIVMVARLGTISGKMLHWPMPEDNKIVCAFSIDGNKLTAAVNGVLRSITFDTVHTVTAKPQIVFGEWEASAGSNDRNDHCIYWAHLYDRPLTAEELIAMTAID